MHIFAPSEVLAQELPAIRCFVFSATSTALYSKVKFPHMSSLFPPERQSFTRVYMLHQSHSSYNYSLLSLIVHGPRVGLFSTSIEMLQCLLGFERLSGGRITLLCARSDFRRSRAMSMHAAFDTTALAVMEKLHRSLLALGVSGLPQDASFLDIGGRTIRGFDFV